MLRSDHARYGEWSGATLHAEATIVQQRAIRAEPSEARDEECRALRFHARSRGGEKLVQLLELLARPTYTPRGHCIVEGFF